MMTIEEQVRKQLEDTAEYIKRNLAEKRINASGRTSRSIKVQRIATGFVLGKFPEGDQTAPLQTLEIGRPGGAVPRGFKNIIWDWMDAKGISTGDPKVDSRIAGAIAYGKIMRIGTNRHQEHEDIFSTPVKIAAAEVTKNINALFATEIRNIINTNF